MNRRSFIGAIVAGLAALKVWPVKGKTLTEPRGGVVKEIWLGTPHRGIITRCDSSDDAYEFNGQDWVQVSPPTPMHRIFPDGTTRDIDCKVINPTNPPRRSHR